MTLVGVYVGNEPEALVQFENWLGSDVDFVRGHGGRASWSDFVGSLGWLASQFSGLDVAVYWNVPMIVTGATLAKAANGTYSEYYRAAARTLVAASDGLDAIHVRIGEEFNGDWMPWAAKGKEADFIATFRQIVDTFRLVSDKFVFEWNVNIGDMGMNPALAWPGDAYVDVVGMDFYWNTAWDPHDPEAAWTSMVERTYGLRWLEDFAAAHGKPTAYSEWGVGADDAGAYVRHAMAWFASHDVLYQSYWNSDADFPGMLSSGQYPATGTAFIEAFGLSGTADLYAVTAGSALGVGAASGVLANDAAGAIAAEPVSGPAHGTLRLAADGAFVYVPDDGFVGTDGFLYVPRGTSGAGSAVGVAIEVVPGFRGTVEGPAASGAWQTYLGGTTAADVLVGDDLNNKLNPGNAADTMTGGRGDDVYTVDWNGDLVVEEAGEGVDTVHSYYRSYALPEHVENLALLGPSGKAGYGNGLANRLEGTEGADALGGRGGDDWLTGNGGRDTFVVGQGGGHDTIADFAAGAGGDRLDLSDFWIDSLAAVRAAFSVSGMVATLALGDGTAVALVGVDPAALTADNLVLGGAPTPPPVSGAWTRWFGGTSGDDSLAGSAGNDKIDGGGGADTMTGGGGDDRYTVDRAGDRVVEAAGAGVDTVDSYAPSHALGDGVENLVLVATYAQGGTGNALGNRITGSVLANRIEGGAGDDWLAGGGGNDVFVFAPGAGRDVVADFAAGDRVDLGVYGFARFAALAARMSEGDDHVTILTGGGDAIRLVGVAVADLGAEQFIL